jgi:hypothetical protein
MLEKCGEQQEHRFGRTWVRAGKRKRKGVTGPDFIRPIKQARALDYFLNLVTKGMKTPFLKQISLE